MEISNYDSPLTKLWTELKDVASKVSFINRRKVNSNIDWMSRTSLLQGQQSTTRLEIKT